MIVFENVSKVYDTAKGPVRALDDVTFDVGSGEFVAVQGASGSGKSTLLMIAGGLSTPTSGKATVAGVDVARSASADLTQFRSEKVGFVFQMFHLLPYLTVFENVAAAARPGHHAEARGRAGELLDRFHLGHRLHHRPAELSAGERQRVAIARALVNRPQLLLADEPTGNLDPHSAAAVLDLLTGFHAEGGTVLMVTHQAESAGYAQRTLSLADGALVVPVA